MTDKREIRPLTEGQSCQQTSLNHAHLTDLNHGYVGDTLEKGQGASQTTQNYQQAIQAIHQSQQGKQSGK